MNMSRKRLLIIVSITVAVLLLAFGGYYLYRAKYSADALIDENDASFLEDMQEQPNLNDPTLIRLPEKYSSDTIQKSLTAGSQSVSKSGVDKEISDLIYSEANRLAKTLPLQVAAQKGQLAMNDLVFRVADSKGNVIRPLRKSRTAKSITVADNFDFDISVTDKEKDLMLRAYPIIEAFYGARQNTDKIHVVHDDNLERGWCAGNEIRLDHDDRNDEPIHELVHAFRGDYMLDSLWEEGSAVVVTTYVEGKLGLPRDEYYSTQAGYRLGFEALPSTYDADISNAWAPWYPDLPYSYGSMTLDKILQEDQNFLKKFNEKIYLAKKTGRADLIRIARSCVAQVEGESSTSWFYHQYPFIPYYYNWNVDQQEMFFTPLADSIQYSGNGGELDYGADYMRFSIRTNYRVDSSDFNVRLLDQNNKVLVTASAFKTEYKDANEVSKYCDHLPPAYKEYKGLVRMEMVPTMNTANKKVITFLKTDMTGRSSDVIVSSPKGSIAIVSDIVTPRAVAAPAVNGYYKFKSDWLAAPGKYRVDIYSKKSNCVSNRLSDCIGTQLDSKTFTKGEATYEAYYIPMPEANICATKIPSINPMNRAVSLTSTTSVNCGHVLAVNGTPIVRYWGKKWQNVLANMAKNRAYRVQLTTASDTSRPATLVRTATTTSYADFRIISSQSFGNAFDNTFYQRFTTNVPYDLASIKLFVSYGRGEEIKTSIRKVSDTIFDVVPEHLYNNYDGYMIVGLDLIKDTHGNQLFKLNWDFATIATGINPPGAPQPIYTVNKPSYGIGEQITLSMNFASTDLPAKLDQISFYRRVGIMDCEEQPGLCDAIPADINILNNELVISPRLPLSVGEYYIVIPQVVDSNNNLVVAFEGYGSRLSFQVR